MSDPTDIQWTDERIEQLRADWDEGLTCGAIGRKRGWSKNAIVGKARRLGLAERPSPIVRRGDPARPYAHRPRLRPIPLPSFVTLATPPPVIEAPLAEPKEEEMVRKPQSRKRVAETGLTCQYIQGDNHKTWMMCGKPTVWSWRTFERVRAPYCAEHCAVCYQGWKEAA